MVSKLLLAGLSLLVLTPTASADRFYFGSPTTAQKISDGTADFIEGVLLREADGQYVIRVEGGEISVAKSLVWKVESNELTVAQLEAREQGATAALASANDIRRERQTTAAAIRRNVLLEARAQEASLRSSTATEAPEAIPTYDPVLDIVRNDQAWALEQILRRKYGAVLHREFERYYRELRRNLRP